MNYGKRVARAGLEINAIKLSPSEPFTWASGFRMPIYNDNRMFLASHANRMLVANGLRNIIESEGIPYDMIAGTSTAGIAPAASLASLLNVPLVITENGKSYVFDGGFLIGGQEFDAVASTCPWAIPYGVQLANNKQLPFMYVRQSKKSHGLKQQIEGIPIAGQRVLLFDYHMGESYAENASDALREKGVEVVEIRSVDIYSILKSRKLTGLKVPMIEDLISTGGSSATAVQDVRNNGATCNHCISIFNYGLNKAAEEFATLNPKCNVTSVLTYDTLLKEAEETEYINPEDSEVLAEWRADPFNWGERHGFPKVEK